MTAMAAGFTPSRPRGQCLSPGRMSFHFNHMPTIHKRLQHFLCSPRFRFHGGNRNGPTAAVSHHGSTRSEFALEHTSHCEKFAQSPPGTAFTIRQVTLRAGISRFPPSSWVRVRGDRPGGREGWRLPFWSKVLRQAIPDRCPVVPRTSAVSRQDLPGPPGRPLSEFFPPNSGRVKVGNEIPGTSGGRPCVC